MTDGEGGIEYIWGTGRRKTAVARVRIKPGSGLIVINGRPFDTDFPIEQTRNHANEPLMATQAQERYDIWANVDGGGPVGQSGAVRLGIVRALRKAEPELEEALRRDGRMVERKKYGQAKARKKFQFSKR
ncbi:MAG: 30S ribosomal protein S9 [Planctomycetota bacterium]|jgi:small subunit ribosomal protein S9